MATSEYVVDCAFPQARMLCEGFLKTSAWGHWRDHPDGHESDYCLKFVRGRWKKEGTWGPRAPWELIASLGEYIHDYEPNQPRCGVFCFDVPMSLDVAFTPLANDQTKVKMLAMNFPYSGDEPSVFHRLNDFLFRTSRTKDFHQRRKEVSLMSDQWLSGEMAALQSSLESAGKASVSSHAP